MQALPGKNAVGPHVPPPLHVPLQYGWVSLSQACVPSGTQPQYGAKSETGAHVRPGSQAPPHENGPPPQGASVVVVVVGGVQ